MITIEEIPVKDIDDFWEIHYEYLLNDEIISDEEDKEYFRSNEYRTIIHQHMVREIDTHHMVYFVKDGVRVGAAQYCTYESEDGKCFILDYWVFPQYRGKGTGHQCFQALEEYTKKNGAIYYELNSTKEKSVRFWIDNGFVYNGDDEYGVKLFIKR